MTRLVLKTRQQAKKLSHFVTEPNLGPLVHSKANLLTPGCGEGKHSIYCKVPDVGLSKENEQGSLYSKDLNSSMAFREMFLSAR